MTDIWECIEPGTFGVERYAVPGGWVYRFLNGPTYPMQVCFVPKREEDKSERYSGEEG